MNFYIYYIYIETTTKKKTILGFSENRSILENYIHNRNLIDKTYAIARMILNSQDYSLLYKKFSHKEIILYEGIIPIFKNEKYILEKHLNEALYEFNDYLTFVENTFICNSIMDLYENRKHDLLYEGYMDFVLEGEEDMSKVSLDIKKLDDEFKAIINF